VKKGNIMVRGQNNTHQRERMGQRLQGDRDTEGGRIRSETDKDWIFIIKRTSSLMLGEKLDRGRPGIQYLIGAER